MITLTHKECIIPLDTSMSHLILDQYPLYNYADENRDIHILCLGGGRFMRQMIMTIASCGQMIGYRLFIHVVANYETECREKLLETAPELRYYAQIDDAVPVDPKHQYVHLSFGREKDLNTNAALKRVYKSYGHCSYVVVSLKDVDITAAVAEKYGQLLSKRKGQGRIPVIHYYSDSTKRVAADIRDAVTMVPFNSAFLKYRKKLDEMMARAFRAHYMYKRIYNPTCTAQEAMKSFVGEGKVIRYHQLSSLATAAHIRYKLMSIGIDPTRAHRSREESMERIAKQYLEKMPARRTELMELEHRRWIMFMISQGYVFPRNPKNAEVFCPDPKLMNRYFYAETGNGEFNPRFRSDDEKLHPCLVPCYTSKRALPKEHDKWDMYGDYPEIDATAYDPLDKISLKLHLFAKKRMKDGNRQKRIRNISDTELQIDLEGVLPDNPKLRDSQKALSAAVKDAIIAGNTFGYKKARDQFLADCSRLDEVTREQVGSTVKELDNEFQIYDEFNRYHDYKDADAGIIDHLLWVYCAEEDLTLVKMYSDGDISNVASYMTLEPREMILYVGSRNVSERKALKERYESTGLVEQGTLAVMAEKKDVTADLLGLAKKHRRILVDVTDTSGSFLAAAMSAAARSPKIDVILFDFGTASVLDLTNHYPLVSAYTLKRKLSAEQVFSVSGARTIEPRDQMDLSILKEEIQKLWKLYLITEEPNSKYPFWSKICDFLMYFSSQKYFAEFYASISAEKLRECDRWTRVEKELSLNCIEASGLENVLKKVQNSGLIRDRKIKPTGPQHATVSFEIPAIGQWLRTRFEYFLDNVGSEPLTFRSSGAAQSNFYLISSGSVSNSGNPAFGSCVYIDRLGLKKQDAGMNQKDENFLDIAKPPRFMPAMYERDFKSMCAFLTEMDNQGLVYRFQCRAAQGFQKSSEDSAEYKLSYKYVSPMLPRFFAKKGNLLEAYAWYQMVSSGVFDNVKPNLSFRWGSDDANDDELDVVATRGMTTMVVSCKMSHFQMEHIMAVKYLSERFSRVALPVIIYSPKRLCRDKSNTELGDKVRLRVADMGVYLIDGRILSSGKLSEAIRQIALGKIRPQDLVSPPDSLTK